MSLPLALARIADSLAAATAEGWTKVVFEATQSGDDLEWSAYSVDATLGGGIALPLKFDGEAALESLRVAMTHSDDWNGLRLVLLPNGLFDCAFMYPIRVTAPEPEDLAVA
jgi:hypothetical protein